LEKGAAKILSTSCVRGGKRSQREKLVKVKKGDLSGRGGGGVPAAGAVREKQLFWESNFGPWKVRAEDTCGLRREVLFVTQVKGSELSKRALNIGGGSVGKGKFCFRGERKGWG